MKKTFAFMAVGMTLLLGTACRKNSETISGSNERESPAIEKTSAARGDGGILIFADEASFEETLAQQQAKKREEIIAWERERGFTSMFETLNQVTDAEDRNEEAALAGQNVQKHSDLYMREQADGRLKEIRYEDGSTTYDYNLADAGYVHLLNAEGKVVIGDKLYQYTEDGVSVTPYDGGRSNTQAAPNSKAISHAIALTSTGGNTVNAGYNWSQTGGWRYWDNSKKRMRVAVTGSSSGPGTSVQVVTHQVNVRVEKKNFWGNWVWGNFTCCNLYSSWKFRFGLTRNNTPYTCPFYYSIGMSTVPVNHSYPGTYWPSINNLVLNLNPPHGTWVSTSGSYFCDAFNVFTYNFNGAICGGPSGISFSISR